MTLKALVLILATPAVGVPLPTLFLVFLPVDCLFDWSVRGPFFFHVKSERSNGQRVKLSLGENATVFTVDDTGVIGRVQQSSKLQQSDKVIL